MSSSSANQIDPGLSNLGRKKLMRDLKHLQRMPINDCIFIEQVEDDMSELRVNFFYPDAIKDNTGELG